MSARSDFRVRWRVRVGYPLGVVFALLAQPTPPFLIAGAAIGFVGLLVRGAAAGHLRKHEQLTTSGPYAHTRNPLYLGSALLAAAALVAGRSWVAALLVTVYFVFFYPAVMRREEEELRAEYGAACDEYARGVPFFFPRLRAAYSGGGKFSWAQYARNCEYQAALGFVLALVLLWAKMLWWH
jgi:protein-S-isoprenylcysteine O-methyltransferase Ste14